MRLRDRIGIGLAAVGAAAMAAIFVIAGHGSALPAHPVVARVTGLYAEGTRRPYTLVIAHAPHAIDGRGMLRLGDPATCRIGDDIDGTLKGVALEVNPHSCRRHRAKSAA
ncbi:hypothetical protein ABDK56_06385 [Sphingomonas sp. ASV193]|uniref:hypothetical protein n=1 Tax=Sphingomonas sp. ASV193 TaxID=3144405 RepID=UPI0032E853B1